jgi:homospermidine synthase
MVTITEKNYLLNGKFILKYRIMAITKSNIREVLKRYMVQNGLGYISIDASLSMDSSRVIMAITEDIEDKTHLN